MADLPMKSAPMSHLSIGEVLALLLEEFPDVTISKIRFLESQGLIDPERTPSGYRKFYDDDVELLRCILREQRENYLPLRVIKDRLDSGEIDPTSEIPRPRGIVNVPDGEALPTDAPALVNTTSGNTTLSNSVPDDSGPHGAEALFARTDDSALERAAAESTIPAEPNAEPDSAAFEPEPDSKPDVPSKPAEPAAPPASLLPGVLLTKDELCSMASISAGALESLESYGVVVGVRGSGGLYGEDALEVAAIAKHFLDAGFDARHLRGWKVAADRETGLFEQMIQPLLRQRNPQSREQAREQLTDMERVGGQLRSALMRAAMRHHFED
jgi:DNA-binding transcriptional MerR regulator